MTKFLRRGIAAGSLAFGAIAAHAAVDSAVTTALTTMQTDGVTIAGVVLVAVISMFAIKFLRKAL